MPEAPPQEASSAIVGIDLGTTFSALAYIDEHGKAVIAPNSDNERITPSVILFEQNEVIVGRIAKNSAVTAPDRVVQFVKRFMGDPTWHKKIDDTEYTAEQLSAIILRRLTQDAQAHIGKPITDAVVTVPAYFNDAERKATQDAGRIAGLEVIGVLNEPTAAAIAYGLDRLGAKQKVIVYDLGGGTFDVTVIDIDGPDIRVIATDGERLLGGKDWDDELINLAAERFEAEHGFDPRNDLDALQDMRNKVEDAKIALSRKPAARVLVQSKGKSTKVEITREEFEERTRGLLAQTETYLGVVLQKAGLDWQQIDRVLLVGGMTRMPAVSEMVKRISGKEPDTSINPDECVAMGAAYYHAMLKVQTAKKAEEAGQPVPEAIVGQLDGLPEQVIGMLDGITVQNVNSHSLGIIIIMDDGKFKNHIMIPAQTPIPAEAKGPFKTALNNQTTVHIKVTEGESADPEDVHIVGECVVSGLPPRPKGAIVDVTYKYDADGRITVEGKDRATGKQATVDIKREGVMDEEAIIKATADMENVKID
jgi:molecular chaperone DnaK